MWKETPEYDTGRPKLTRWFQVKWAADFETKRIAHESRSVKEVWSMQ